LTLYKFPKWLVDNCLPCNYLYKRKKKGDGR